MCVLLWEVVEGETPMKQNACKRCQYAAVCLPVTGVPCVAWCLRCNRFYLVKYPKATGFGTHIAALPDVKAAPECCIGALSDEYAITDSCRVCTTDTEYEFAASHGIE